MKRIKKIDLADKVILVSGGYGYLGKHIVENLLAHGSRVYVLGRSIKKFEGVFKAIGKQDIHFVDCDISEYESIKKAFQLVLKAESQIDVLINNAFYSKGQDPEGMALEDWKYGIDGTLNSIFLAIKAIIPYFKDHGHGKIINVASMYGMIAPDFEIYSEFPEYLNPPHYGASKAGVIQLTKYYASYLGKFDITVNSVAPGPFPSDTVRLDKEFVNLLAEKTALGKVGNPEDVAGIFTFLSSEASDYITGQNFVVDGGWTIKS